MKISDEERRRVAKNLREIIWYMRKNKDFYQIDADAIRCGNLTYRNIAGSVEEVGNLIKGNYVHIVELLADLIEPQPIDGNTSDGYHTFDELYHHRAVLFSVIVGNFATRAWKSKLHADGTMYEGMFIVGIETPDGQATYHYDVEPYWHLFRCKEVDRAPEWDGHTPGQAIERISKLVDLIDRPTCRNVYDENEMGNCINGFECSECGNVVEDYEGYRVSGEFNYCSKCRREVVE